MGRIRKLFKLFVAFCCCRLGVHLVKTRERGETILAVDLASVVAVLCM